MPFNLGGPELVFILVIVLIVFGAGKLPTVFGQLGRGVRTFREEAEKPAVSGGPAAPASGAAGTFCTSCGKPNSEGAKFCASCGSPLAV